MITIKERFNYREIQRIRIYLTLVHDFEQCTCKLKNRVPLAERDFLSDQRSDRRMVIAELDKATTISNKKNKRRLKRAKQFHHLPLCSETSSNTSKAVMLSEE